MWRADISYRSRPAVVEVIPLDAVDLEMALAGVKTFLMRDFAAELRVRN